MAGRIGAYAALAGGFILAGSSVVSGKALADLPVFFAAAGGTAVALLALIPLAAAERRPAKGAVLKSLPLLAAQAFFGIALFRALMLAALGRTSASEVGIATSATPAITALLSVLFLKERIGWRGAAGVALTAAGIAVLESGGLAAGGAANLDAKTWGGCLLALGAAASESIFNALSKRLDASIGPRWASALVMALALAMLSGLSLATGERVDLGSLGAAHLLAFAYQGFFVSALAYMLWYAGIARVPVSTAGVFSGFMPLSSFALSAVILGERPGAWAYVGCALAMGGMVLCAIPRRGDRRRATSANGARGRPDRLRAGSS